MPAGTNITKKGTTNVDLTPLGFVFPALFRNKCRAGIFQLRMLFFSYFFLHIFLFLLPSNNLFVIEERKGGAEEREKRKERRQDEDKEKIK